MTRKWWVFAAAGVVVAGAGVVWQQAWADSPATLQIALPANVAIVVGQSQVHIIGRPTSISPVNCAPGTAQPQSAVVVDPGGGTASQITGGLFFHDHEVPNGSRYKITAGPDACNTDFKLYTGTVL